MDELLRRVFLAVVVVVRDRHRERIAHEVNEFYAPLLTPRVAVVHEEVLENFVAAVEFR